MKLNESIPPAPIQFEENSDGSTRLTASQWVPATLEEVFRFFSRPENLQTLTPASMRFVMKNDSPVEMREGLELRYSLRVKGLPMRWTSRVSHWDPPHAFSDTQIQGPYRTWEHTHRFTPEGSGVRVEDEVRFETPGFRWMERLFVRPDLVRIFEFRQRALDRLYAVGGSNLA